MYAEPRSVWINGANAPSLTLACSNTLIAPSAVSVGVINQLTGYCPYRSNTTCSRTLLRRIPYVNSVVSVTQTWLAAL